MDLVNVVQHDTQLITSRVLFALTAVALFVTAFSITVITTLTGSFYTAAYYTISSMFDAVGVDVSGTLLSSAPNFSSPFYLLVSLSILDGVVKTVIVGAVLASVINLFSTLDIHTKLEHIFKRDWKNHVVICGYSFLAEKVASELERRKIPVLVVDRNVAKSDMIREEGFSALHEDFTTDAALKNANIKDARAVVFLTENDYSNLLGAVTARHLNNTIKIIARAGDSSTVTKIHRAGADLCVVPEVLAGIEVGEAIIKRRWG